MAMNRPIFRSGVAPCIAGAFVALFSGSALGQEEAQCDEAEYSLVDLVGENVDNGGMTGQVRVLVPQTIVMDSPFEESEISVVATYIPVSSFQETTYRTGGGVSERGTILSPEAENWQSDRVRVEPLVALGWREPVGGSETRYEVIDSCFSMNEDTLTLTRIRGGPDSVDLALDRIQNMYSQTITDCYASDPWGACNSMIDSTYVPRRVLKRDEEDENTGSLWVPSSLELLANQRVRQGRW